MNILLQKVNVNRLLISIMLLMVSISSYATQDQDVEFSDAELAQMLAPIALYPDSLLTHILIASTYPLEVVEAERWLAKREALSKEQIAEQSEELSWDASVKALLPFPTVIAKLSEDLSWMQNLGDAFLQDEENLLATIQVLRQQAEAAGSLAKMDNVQIVKEKTTIIIEPSEPEVIYVPYYDTRIVYGSWYWSHYPPVYWNTPRYYGYHRGPFYWNSGVHIGFDFFFTGFHWHNRHVVVDYSSPRRYHPRKRISTSHQAKRWHHKPVHRRGVAYKSNHLERKYSSSRPVITSTRKVSSPNRVTRAHSTNNDRKRIHNSDGKKTHAPVNKNTRMAEPRHREFKQKLQARPSVKPVKPEPKSRPEKPVRIKERDNTQSFHSNEKAVINRPTFDKSPTYSTTSRVRATTKHETKERKTYNKPRANTSQRIKERNNSRNTRRVRENRREKN